MRMLLVFVLLAGCAGTFEKANHSQTLHYANRAGLATALALTACDWGSSVLATNGNFEEINPIMGAHPSTTTVSIYMGSVMVVTAATWYLLPESWKPAVWTPVTGVETHALYHQTSVAIPVCGIQ